MSSADLVSSLREAFMCFKILLLLVLFSALVEMFVLCTIIIDGVCLSTFDRKHY